MVPLKIHVTYLSLPSNQSIYPTYPYPTSKASLAQLFYGLKARTNKSNRELEKNLFINKIKGAVFMNLSKAFDCIYLIYLFNSLF